MLYGDAVPARLEALVDKAACKAVKRGGGAWGASQARGY